METGNLCIATLLRRHPWAEEVLEWHGVDVFGVDQSLSLDALCWLERLDQDRVLRDLAAARLSCDPTEVPAALS